MSCRCSAEGSASLRGLRDCPKGTTGIFTRPCYGSGPQPAINHAVRHTGYVGNELLDQVGGREGIAEIVDDFYRRVEADEHMRPIYPEDLTPGREKLKLFLEQWLGGEARYSQLYGHPRLRRRHFPFIIDQLSAGRWLRHMREAMTAHNVPREAQDVMFERLGPLAHHMVNAGLDVPREPLGDAFMQ